MDQESNKQDTSFWTVKKTEYGWIKAQDAFALKVADAWFDFVGRLLILGALRYLMDHGNSRFVTIIYVLSLGILYFYLQSLLYNFPFHRFLSERLIKNGRIASGFSIIVAGLLLFIIYLVLNSVVAALATK